MTNPVPANLQEVSIVERLNQLTTLIGEQQAVISDFVKENRELRSSIDKLESNVVAIDTDIGKLKDEVSCQSEVASKKGSKRLDSNLTVCIGLSYYRV